MLVSLIVATLGRTSELKRLLASLDGQTYRNFELIVVDQNSDRRLEPILDPFRGRYPIFHLCCTIGASKARNVGLRHMAGDAVAFPDDDCWYPNWLLEKVVQILKNTNWDGLSGCIIDEAGEVNSDARFDTVAGKISITNVWHRVCMVGMFLRKNVVDAIGGLDETLGPGAGTPWGGAEDIDYPVRAIKAGLSIYYNPDIKVFHPSPSANSWGERTSRAYAYGAGIGRVWRKHGFPHWLVAYYLVRPFGGSVLYVSIGDWSRARYQWNAFRGRLRGLLSSHKS